MSARTKHRYVPGSYISLAAGVVCVVEDNGGPTVLVEVNEDNGGLTGWPRIVGPVPKSWVPVFGDTYWNAKRDTLAGGKAITPAQATQAKYITLKATMLQGMVPPPTTPTQPTDDEWVPITPGDEVAIGDEVKANSDIDNEYLVGEVGVVRVIDGGLLGVEWPETFTDGNELTGHLPGSTRGWWVRRHYVMRRKNKKKKEAKPVVADYTKLAPLIVAEAVKTEIISVLKQHQHAKVLFEEWGLGDVIEYGRGMTFMFYGPPGTGKTFAATLMAKALGTTLLQVGAAEIQSSEPGGANRAIQQAFKTAKEKGQVLFIDECDSLITTRNDLGMVLASEVNTLLTEIERFEGVCVLATNRVDTMDEALERRLSLIVEFPAPDRTNRKLIWRGLLPAKMPLGKDVDIGTLSREPLTGGQIKNAVLQAARLALAEEAKAVEYKHFKVAIERIKASKNLMGTASRYHQGLKQDVGVSRGGRSGIDTGVGSFLDTMLEKEDEKNADN